MSFCFHPCCLSSQARLRLSSRHSANLPVLPYSFLSAGYAQTFALSHEVNKFYDTLLEGISSSRGSVPSRNSYLAEALLATKRYFMEEYNNPLGLAYVLYANNEARIKVDSM
jgi:hypothetical protein